jgi:hypothetical protein
MVRVADDHGEVHGEGGRVLFVVPGEKVIGVDLAKALS